MCGGHVFSPIHVPAGLKWGGGRKVGSLPPFLTLTVGRTDSPPPLLGPRGRQRGQQPRREPGDTL